MTYMKGPSPADPDGEYTILTSDANPDGLAPLEWSNKLAHVLHAQQGETSENDGPTAEDDDSITAAPKATSGDQKERVAELARSAERFLLRGMTTRAEQALNEALKLDPTSSRAQTGLGYVYLERGRVRQAHVLFRKASRRGFPEAFIGLGAALRELNRNKAALNAYKTYIRRFPKGRSASIATRQIHLLEEAIREKKETP